MAKFCSDFQKFISFLRDNENKTYFHSFDDKMDFHSSVQFILKKKTFMKWKSEYLKNLKKNI